MVRDPGERARWLSAVLIVVSIVAVSAIVRLWPAPPAIRAAGPLASHPLPLVETPFLSAGIPASVLGSASMVPVVDSPAPLDAPPEVTPVAALGVLEPPARTVSDEPVVDPTPADSSPLASRFLDIPRFEPVTVASTRAAHPTEESPGSSFVEIPVVVVSRALEVAGRGIKTGVRATGALVRLAF